MARLFRISGFRPFIGMMFLNAFVDVFLFRPRDEPAVLK